MRRDGGIIGAGFQRGREPKMTKALFLPFARQHISIRTNRPPTGPAMASAEEKEPVKAEDDAADNWETADLTKRISQLKPPAPRGTTLTSIPAPRIPIKCVCRVPLIRNLRRCFLTPYSMHLLQSRLQQRRDYREPRKDEWADCRDGDR